MLRLEYTKGALSDLDNIWEYSLENWGQTQAETYISQLEQSCHGLTQNGHVSRALLALPANIDYIKSQHHYIFFVKSEKVVTILAILHERMDLIARLEDRL